MDNIKNRKGETEQEFLKNYNSDQYQKPSVTVDLLIFSVCNKYYANHKKTIDKTLKLLLIKRKDHPFIGQWALPGGFVDIDEGITETAHRELQEETGVRNVYLEQLYTFGDNPKRDPRMRVISVSYMALIPNVLEAVAGDDAAEAKWFTLKRENNNDSIIQLVCDDDESIVIEYKKTINGEFKSVSKDMLAFDHIQIINMGLERLKNKIEYTNIAFELLPEKFHLFELQKVYEIILNKKIDKSNFRKMIINRLQRTNEYSNSGVRKTILYKQKEREG